MAIERIKFNSSEVISSKPGAKILVIGAHTDDIEVFCGGTLFRAIEEGNEVRCAVCIDQYTHGEIEVEEQKRAWIFLGVTEGYFLKMRNTCLQHSGELVTKFDEIIGEYKPDIVFSHTELDSNQDHIAVARCVRSANRAWSFNWITFPSYDLRSPFVPNVFINIDSSYERKKELIRFFESQKGKWYLTEDVLLARSLGSNIGRYIEQFRLECGFVK